MIICLCGCKSQKEYTLSQSQEHFKLFKEKLEKLSDDYSYDLSEVECDYIDDKDSYLYLEITNGSNENIQINMINSVYESDKGTESFDIVYDIADTGSEAKFNTHFFVNIFNSLSDQKIDEETLIKFLDAPEDEYSAEKYGYKKQDGELVEKCFYYDFWETLGFHYVMTDDLQELRSGGLLKII